VSWPRPASGWRAEASKAPGVVMKEPTSSEDMLLNETPAAGSWMVCDALELEGASEGCALRPVNASQTPIVMDSGVLVFEEGGEEGVGGD
jgi:hypothetical protein